MSYDLQIEERHTRVYTKRFAEKYVREMLANSVANQAGVDISKVSVEVETVSGIGANGIWVVRLTEDLIGKEPQPDAEMAA